MFQLYIPIFVALVCLVPMCSDAQVIKCVDQKTGRITYADTHCSDRVSGTLLERQKTTQEIQTERIHASQASEREYLDQARRADSKNQEIRAAQSGAAQSAQQLLSSSDKSISFECKKAQKDLETVSGIRTGTAEYRRNRVNAEISKVNVECGTKTAPQRAPVTVKVEN